MAYQQVKSPRFFIDALQYHMKLGDIIPDSNFTDY